MQTSLIGIKINLRELKNSDVNSIYENAKDPELAKYYLLPIPYEFNHAVELITITNNKLQTKEAISLGIEDKITKQIIGLVSLSFINFSNNTAEIGYWIGKKYWNQGIMTESINLILNFAFNDLKLKRVYARVMHPNMASSRLLENSGFKYEGQVRKGTYRNDVWVNDLFYSILDNEYNEQPKLFTKQVV
ncbi:MAG: GNAT family protein [Candidatus ainarchaeum sp.]|nr:GNAT family protein [Candidatus ainarchaeum sp.]